MDNKANTKEKDKQWRILDFNFLFWKWLVSLITQLKDANLNKTQTTVGSWWEIK